MVIIPPRHRTEGNARQTGDGHIREPAPRVAPKLGNGSAAGLSRDQKIEAAVVVIIPPRHRTVVQARQANAGHRLQHGRRLDRAEVRGKAAGARPAALVGGESRDPSGVNGRGTGQRRHGLGGATIIAQRSQERGVGERRRAQGGSGELVPVNKGHEVGIGINQRPVHDENIQILAIAARRRIPGDDAVVQADRRIANPKAATTVIARVLRDGAVHERGRRPALESPAVTAGIGGEGAVAQDQLAQVEDRAAFHGGIAGKGAARHGGGAARGGVEGAAIVAVAVGEGQARQQNGRAGTDGEQA